MDPITTALVTSIATGLAKDAAKTGYEKLKNLIFGSADAQKKTDLETALIALEKAQADIQALIAASGAGANPAILASAADLMKQAGQEITNTGSISAIASGGGKALATQVVQGGVTM